MIRTFKAAVAALMLAVGFAGSVAAGPLEDALAAYVRGDYATALRLTRPLAEHGDAHAQFALGVQYAPRVPLSGNGQGPQDYIIAHMWFSLAAASGYPDAAQARDEVASKMTPAQIEEAQKLAREWKPK